MKRSEMIKLMNVYFRIHKSESSMDKLLWMIEKAGMLPPRNPNATFEQQLGHKGLHFWEKE